MKEGSIPIVAYNPTPWKTGSEAYAPDVETFQKIIQCGFNATMIVNSWELLDKSFNTISNLDSELFIRVIINSGSYLAVPYPEDGQSHTDVYQNVMISYINKYKSEISLWGWMLFDEPKYLNLFGQFSNPENAELLKGVQDLKESYDTYINESPGKVSYFNLVCSDKVKYLGSEILNNPNYNTSLKKYYAYLTKINNIYHPALWSFDFYPVKLNSSGTIFVESIYYSYLEAFKTISNLSNRPFWATILSTHHDTYSNPEDGHDVNKYAAPTEGILRFQIFSALAYGCQGIIYWTYGKTTDKYFDNGLISEKYYSALVDVDNVPTPTWYAAQKVNKEIKDMTPVFYGAKCLRVVHVYNPAMMAAIQNSESPAGMFTDTTTMSGSFYCLDEVTVPNDGKGVMISYMTKNNNKFLVFVSHDPVNSQNIKIAINLDYNWNFYEMPATPINEVTSTGEDNDSNILSAPGISQELNFTLAPGGYKVLYFSKK